MTTIQRLADDDVRAIYECLHNNRQPPPHLPFTIVPTGPKDQTWSPPSLEFENGLYVLLKPNKKNKKRKIVEEPQKVPPHLTHLVMTDFPPSGCPWQLSGPQFPKPTAIQQRYCYPKGETEYSNMKGGALWTMFNADGKEYEEYRLLQVYDSPKRAISRGLKASTKKRIASASPSSRKRGRTGKTNSDLSPSSAPVSMASPVTASVASSRSLSFDIPSYDSAALSPTFLCHPNTSNTNFVTPIFEKLHPLVVNNSNTSSSPPQPVYQHQRNHSNITADTFADALQLQNHEQATMTFARQYHHNNVSPPNSREEAYKPTESPQTLVPAAHSSTSVPGSPLQDYAQLDTVNLISATLNDSWEPFPFDMDADLMDFDPSWTDAQPESDIGSCSTQEERISLFADRLYALHESMKERIFLANESEQGPMLTMLSSWAKQIAQEPLGRGAVMNSAKSKT